MPYTRKSHNAATRFSGELVAPDEMDRYEVYSVQNIAFSDNWVGTCVASGPTATATMAFGFLSKLMDVPRNIRLLWTDGAGTKCGGTAVIVGKNQFGVLGTETIAKLGTAAATVEGTAIYSQITSVTLTQWGSADGANTVAVGGALLGTTGKLGLPFKIGSTADVSMLMFTSNGTSVPVNQGTIGAFVDATYHAIKFPKTIAGTVGFTVWAKPSYNTSTADNYSARLQLLT